MLGFNIVGLKGFAEETGLFGYFHLILYQMKPQKREDRPHIL